MDLASIAPATRTVPLGSGTVAVTGLSLRKLTQLVLKYPELLALAAGKIELQHLVVAAPDAMLAIFVVGMVEPAMPKVWQFWISRAQPGAAALVKAFDAAATGQQIEVLAQIFELTFAGERARPFLRDVVASLGENPPPEASANTSPPPSPS